MPNHDNKKPLKCPCCGSVVNESFLLHNLSPIHVFNYYIWSFEQKRQALVKDKEGIGLQVAPILLENTGIIMDFRKKKGKYDIQLDMHDLMAIENTLKFRCTVLNDRKEDIILLTAFAVLDAYPWASCFDDKTPHWMATSNVVEIKPKQKYDGLVLKFQMENMIAGCFRIPFAVNLQPGNEKAAVTISRTICVNVVDKKVAEPIIDDEQKSPFTDVQWEAELKRITPPFCMLVQLKNYPIPRKYEKHFRNGLKVWKGMKTHEMDTLELLKDQMKPGHVTKTNYKHYFHNCLWLEEQTNAIMLNKYNMENVTMKIHGHADLKLEVPGLAEKRPSLIQGDMILIRLSGDHTGYEGYIKTVENNHVIISLVDEELLETVDEDPDLGLDVAFKLGRLPYERAHEGIDKVCADGGLKRLFPDELPAFSCQDDVVIKDNEFFNETIFGNLEQRTAVEKIVNRSSGLAPYIVFGPPGTGKTVTIVEAIVQILKRTNKRILICAPANAACDMLASKLIPYCTKKELIRVHSESRDRSTIPKEVVACSNMMGSSEFMKIGPKDLQKYRIVVSTLILIGKFSGNDYRPEVLFIDEAAQALETDICVPLGVLVRNGQMVLAGDPQQLGPIVQSTAAQLYGLNKSLLERLMQTQKVYENHVDPDYITMLKKNFRSHPIILDIPNTMFYNDQLEAIAERPINDPVSKYSIYPNILSQKGLGEKVEAFVAGKAMEFCAVSAKEQKEGRSPSYFNPTEANMVIQYIKTLINMKLSTNDKVEPSDIGVITPYIRQVYKIKGLLQENKLKDVEVGSTEAFQGREKRVIIISTVRAQNDLLQHDQKYSLGFVKQDKRFNVAITRAISKLIVIGCPAVLSTDRKWKTLMERCQDLNVYYGAPYVERTEDNMEKIVEKFKNFPGFAPPKK